MSDERSEPDLVESPSTHLPSSTGHQQIGPYRLREKLGEGGMGEVWLAEQTEPVRRRVALKIIKRGMDTEQVVARFEAERQALALMNHANVARVFDAGATPHGRPYFAMEHVQGVPITEHCDRQRLSTRERLELFQQVCAGVQHAHQKGIIHRDIKPSNVLVAIQDAERVPKIIDFGVAKATQQRLTEKTLFTEMGVPIGTPEYMSPEQAEMTAEDIDTRTDVYSLGVLLYELLVGALPFDSKELRRAGFDEIRRRIREQEPSKPSQRVNTLVDASAEFAQRRQTDVPTLLRQLRGDLDCIVMKAMEKDRTRRYGSPHELAADIGRHLSHEPVLASPPSTVYRARKFVRRHRVGVVAAALSVGVLVAFTVTTTVQSRRIAREARRAQTEAAIAAAVNAFLNDDLLAAVAPQEQGIDVSMREVLGVASARIEGKFDDQPLVEAAIRNTLGGTYRSLGEYSNAELHLERSRDLVREALGESHEKSLVSDRNLADLYRLEGRYEEAEALYATILESQRASLGEDHPETVATVKSLAVLKHKQGHYEEAERLARMALEKERSVLGADHPDTLAALSNLASLVDDMGRFEEAEALHSEVLEIRRRVHGDEHPNTLSSMGNLVNTYRNQGRYDDADALCVEALEVRRRVLGEEHPRTLATQLTLAGLRRLRGRYDEAVTLFEEALAASRRTIGDEHPDSLVAMNNLALTLREQGRAPEAEALYLEVLEIRGRVLGDDHPRTVTSMGNLAALYRSQKRYDEARPLMERALENERRLLGEEHPETLVSTVNLARLYHGMGRYEEAERLLQTAIEGQRRLLGETHPDTLISMHELARVWTQLGRYDEAADLQTTLIGGAREHWPEGHWYIAAFLAARGTTLVKLDRMEEAEATFIESYEIYAAALGKEDSRARGAAGNLVALYEARGDADKAAEWNTKSNGG